MGKMLKRGFIKGMQLLHREVSLDRPLERAPSSDSVPSQGGTGKLGGQRDLH